MKGALLVTLATCLVLQKCWGAWQENVRPKMYVQLGKSIFFKTFKHVKFLLRNNNHYSIYSSFQKYQLVCLVLIYEYIIQYDLINFPSYSLILDWNTHIQLFVHES